MKFTNARWPMGFTVLGLLAMAAAVAAIASCGSAPTPFVVSGPGGSGNSPPTLTFVEPNDDITVARGVPLIIQWQDEDRDDNAVIGFQLIELVTNRVINLASDILENDSSAPDSITVATGSIAEGTYNLVGVIDDDVNAIVTVYATVGESATDRLEVRVVGEGEGQQSSPPIVEVIEPDFDRSVTQDDVLTVVVQPTAAVPVPDVTPPFDADSATTLFLLFDIDQDPNNDDPFNPDPNQLIVLREVEVPAGQNALDPFQIVIDLNDVPARPNGEPYFVRATITDGQNSPVHSYAPGRVNVVQLASGTVDLYSVGRTTSGARVYGFNPRANLGSKVRGVTDFDEDGIDDFVMVAQFGNPQTVGPVGEAYLLYGLDQVRFGGTISANSISQTLSGAVFQAPPVRPFRTGFLSDTLGITDVDFIRDITQDGRPEILFGLPFVNGAYDSTDYDPGDDPEDAEPGEAILGCYPDPFVNNAADTINREGLTDVGWFSGGMAVMVNSQNRDLQGGVDPADRLENTAVTLELSGQFQVQVLGADGFDPSGNIFVRADNVSASDDDLGTDEEEPVRISGARFIAGGFDWLERSEPPRDDLFGMNVSSILDLTSDGLDEIIISAPRNERYFTDLQNDPNAFLMYFSTIYTGSIVVHPGTNFNTTFWRDHQDETGTSTIPILDSDRFPGACSDPSAARAWFSPLETFQIFAEHIDDFLGGGKSAGDFNQDGIGDILCSGPSNDRTGGLRDSGAAYIIYGRTVFGDIHLNLAQDPVLRPPMLRIRGDSRGDQLGLVTAAGLDVNGDRVDDVFIASARADYEGVTRNQCIGDFNGDGLANGDDLSLSAFSDCQVRTGSTVFNSDPCNAFDYDNDSDIDDGDRCVFCCLSGGCTVDSACLNGQDSANCCADMVDNGFVGVIFGGRFVDGDRDLSQVAKPDLPGVAFYGGSANDLAGWDVSSAGDFNQDGFGDILIAAPGEIRKDSAGRNRVGVVYLVFGGTHLASFEPWNLSDPDRGVGTDALPGIVFFSPYVSGRPNEAAPTSVGFIGDVNNDGFGDIAIGNPKADFIDLSFPQGPDAPGDDPSAGRRSDAGDVYIIYGNNFGNNRGGGS